LYPTLILQYRDTETYFPVRSCSFNRTH